MEFVFSTGGYNPISVKDAGSFTIQTYQVYSGTDYLID
jgi:hypothetical protein